MQKIKVDLIFRTKWNSDEFVGGAYCYRSTAGDGIHGDITAALCKPVMQVDQEGNVVRTEVRNLSMMMIVNQFPSFFQKPVILLAGEALSKTHYSTIHGAFETGISQGAKIVEFFNGVKSKTGFGNQNAPNSSLAELQKSIEISEISQLSTELQLACQITNGVVQS